MIRFRKTKTAHRKRDSHDLHLQFGVDSLEQRQMLAGQVSTAVAGGSLTLSGDGQDNVVAMFEINGSLGVLGIDTEIADADFTATEFGIDFELKLVDGVTKDVTAILRGGDDTLLFGGSAEDIDLEDVFGSDPSFGPASVPRDLKVFTNGGNDTVLITGTEVGRDIVIDTGFGLNDTVIIGGGGVALAVLDVLQEIEFDDFASASLFPAGVGGGNHEVIGEIAYALLGEVETGRDLRIFGASSDDAIYVGGASIGRDVTIYSNIGEDSLYFGTGAVIEVHTYFPNTDSASSNGILEGLGELSASVHVGRNAFLHTGDGDDTAWIGGQRLFSFHIDNPDRVSLDGGRGFVFGFDGGVVVEKDLTLNTSSHDDFAYVGVAPRFIRDATAPTGTLRSDGEFVEEPYNVVVGRDMNLLTQADDDYLQIGGTVGEATIGTTETPPFFVPEGVLKVDRDLNIETGPGTDEVVIGDLDPVIFRLSGAEVAAETDDEFTFYLVDIGRDSTIETGWHDDNIYVKAFPAIFPAGQLEGTPTSVANLKVGRDMDVNTDGGNDNFHLGFTDFDLDPARAGVETNSLGGDGPLAIYIGRDLTVLTGDQDDLVTIDFTFIGDDVDIRTWWGSDEVLIGYNGFFWGTVSIGDQLKIDTSLERDIVMLEDVTVRGNATINTGVRDDELTIRYSSFGGNLTAIMGRGNDAVLLHQVDAEGNIRIDGQRENDDVHVIDTVATKLTVLGGADDDNVCVFGGAFSGGAIFNGGPGEDDGLSTDLTSFTETGFEGPADCNII